MATSRRQEENIKRSAFAFAITVLIAAMLYVVIGASGAFSAFANEYEASSTAVAGQNINNTGAAQAASYTVDFYYTSGVAESAEGTEVTAIEYHMAGGSEMLLSELFTQLGIVRSTADIASVDFTDESLVAFTKSGNDYTIAALQPFTTSETLTIAFADGEILTIDVADSTARVDRTINNKWQQRQEFPSQCFEWLR